MGARRDRVVRLLGAKTLAFVGASDSSPWSQRAVANATALGALSRVHLVNRRGVPAHGRPTVPTCAAIGEPVDAAVLLVPNRAIPDVLRDVASAGISGAVLLGAGYGETGDAGRAAEDRLRELAGELGVTLLGPNCLGFASVVDRTAAWVGALSDPLAPGPIAVVSQSGNIAVAIAEFAATQQLGVSHVVSTGNEVDVDLVDVVDGLLDDERVRVFAVFAESIRRPRALLDVAARAAARKKAIVVLKVGASALGAELARTHTGALADDDVVVDAAFRQAGVIRVTSLEELVVTAGLIAHTGPLPPGGLGVVSMTGGGNDILADRADHAGVPLPEPAESTRSRLEDERVALGLARIRNPLDLTGAAAGKLDRLMAPPLEAFANDPSMALVAGVFSLPPARSAELFRPGLAAIGKGLAAAGRRGVLLFDTLQTVTPAVRSVLDDVGIAHAVGGFEQGITAMGHALRWSEWLRRGQPAVGAPPAGAVPAQVRDASGTWSEARTLELLATHDVPTVPWRLAGSADAAVAAAQAIGYPVVVKVASADIVHKSDIDGVILDVRSDAEVRTAYEAVTAAAAERAPDAAVDGVMIAALRRGGVELLVGAVRKPHWGVTLVVGFGGLLVDALGDSSLRLLPVDRAEARRMLGELRAATLLDGFRGAAPADVDRLLSVIVRFGDLALALGPGLRSIEANPVRIDGSEIEVLDAVAEWVSPPEDAPG